MEIRGNTIKSSLLSKHLYNDYCTTILLLKLLIMNDVLP